MEIEPIARVETCYPEKFGVPRQPGLVKQAWGRIIFEESYRAENFIRGIEGFSHLWIVFHFHLASQRKGKETVRPPRLGGNERVGVFASRAPFRPNNLGLSVVELVEVDYASLDGPVLKIRGADLVSGTPVMDIKPYVPFCDSVPSAIGGFVDGEPVRMEVAWCSSCIVPEMSRTVIEQTLALDPRPAYHVDLEREYGCEIDGYAVRWRVEQGVVKIFACEPSQ
ncbi:tRNA (N6-threonylcarbamoyladenosine(37)-N6)-methyltransferase TrmO [Rubritalea spongiae]|uniref:tRNA (N6-threonylcarbamoyladenosine(37)-N6)-methyltransferase TrmO n=1 Tax=Rubritalea spongiae TaxID=430797 RepID=A0ABW5E7E1_9BACT